MLLLQHKWKAALAGLVLLGVIVHAQQPASRISYVASVKPNHDPEPRTVIEYLPGGRLSATAVTVGALLRIAYRMQDYRILGSPDWLSTSRYDISAKVDDNPPPSQQALLQALLAERFHLAVHNETREQPTFALVLSRSDRRPGPQLALSDFDCAAYGSAPHAPPVPGRTPPCATRINPGFLSGKSIPMTQLASSLSPFVRRFTVDKTGLPGRFDVELTWTPEQAPPSAVTTVAPDAARSDSPGPSLFTALQEQLGLKLVAERGPVDVLIIDHVEKASGN